MRKPFPLWDETFAKLGFRRRKKSDVKGKARKTRSLQMETLEPKQLLAADLALSSFHGEQDNLLVQYEVAGETAQAFDVDIYKSVDGVALGELVATERVSDAADLAVGSHSLPVSLDFTETQDDYYFVAQVDSSSENAESDETNNTGLFSGVFLGDDGIIYVHGTDGGDDISITQPGMVWVNIDGTTSKYTAADVNGIHLRMHDGDDSAIAASGVLRTVWAFGGEGIDTLYGGRRDDFIHGGTGNDILKGRIGDDQIIGGDGDDELIGDAGDDALDGSAGDDDIQGNENDDIITGGPGDDDLAGGFGDDVIYGGLGADTLEGNEGTNSLDGGKGLDLVDGVQEVNTAPTSSGIADVTVEEDAQPTVIDLFAAFEDAEETDAELEYWVTNRSNPALFETPAIGQTAGALTLTYAANANGQSDVTIRAVDPDGLFIETTFGVTVSPVNDSPLIGTLYTDPGPAIVNADMTLWLDSMVDDSWFTLVAFYRDSDGDGQLNIRVDDVLGADVDGSDGWSVTRPADFGLGTHTYFAQAVDSEGVYGNVAETTGMVDIFGTLDDQSHGYEEAVVEGGQPVAWTDGASSGGYSGTYRQHAAGTGDNVARWTFTGLKDLPHGIYVTWPSGTATATNAKFTVYDGDTLLETFTVDQTSAPASLERDNAWWHTLDTLIPQSGILTIELSDDANGTVVADAVMVVDSPPTIDLFTTDKTQALVGESVTLAAYGVDDADGTIQSVSFYIDDSSPTGWDADDTLLGAGSFDGVAWTLTKNDWTTNTYDLIARAKDNSALYTNATCSVEILTDVTSNLAGLWHLDEGEGDNAGDSSATPYGGTLQNNPQWTTGYSGSGLRFDGRDDYVTTTVPNIAGDITISAWIKPQVMNVDGEYYIVSNGPDGESDQAFLRIKGDGEDAYYEVGCENEVASIQVPSGDIDQWVHLAGTYDAASKTWKLYRNAGTPDTTVGSNVRDSVSDTWIIAADDNGTDSFFHGTIDEVRIYDAELSSANITTIANTTGGPSSLLRAPVVDDQCFVLSPGAEDEDDVGTVVVADENSDDTHTFVIIGGNEDQAFSIDNTGLIEVADDSKLDLYGNDSYTLTVTVTDSHGTFPQSDTAQITIVPTQPTMGLVGHWKLDESAGTSAADSSDNDNAGTLENFPTSSIWTTGEFDGGLLFAGTDDYVNLGNPDELNFSGQIALSAWIKPGGSGDQDIVSHGPTDTNDASVFMRIRDGKYQVGSSDALGTEFMAESSSSVSNDVDTWVHLAAVYDGNEWTLYHTKNGTTNADSSVQNFGAFEVNADWFIGACDTDPPTYHFDGVIDDVRIYNRPLDSSEIGALADNDVGFPTLQDQLVFAIADETEGVETVGDIVATPPHSGVALGYSIESGNVNDTFVIHPSSGNLSIDSGKSVDYSTNPIYRLVVKARVDVTGEEDPYYRQCIVSIMDGDLTDSLEGHWKLDEETGTDAEDATANDNDGELGDSATIPESVTGRLDGAWEFDGSDYVSMPDGPAISDGADFSLSAWIKPQSDSGTQYIIGGHADNPDDNDVFLRIEDGKYEIGSYDDTDDYKASFFMPAGDIGNWVHLVGTYKESSGNWILYRNGKEVASATDDGSSQASTWMIGAGDDGTGTATGFFTGTIDDVRIYDDVLTATEAAVLAQQTPQALTLTASSAVIKDNTIDFTVDTLDPGGTANAVISKVEFYLDDGDGELSGESVAHTDSSSTGGWTYPTAPTASLSPGTYTYFAKAFYSDSTGYVSLNYVSCQVIVTNTIMVIDNGQDVYAETGDGFRDGFDYVDTAYHQGYRRTDDDEDKATWTFSDLETGETYLVYATYANGPDFESSALYEGFDGEATGEAPLEETVDQSKAPTGLDYDGRSWKLLGSVDVTGTMLTVQASKGDSDAQWLATDGVMIRKYSPQAEVVDSHLFYEDSSYDSGGDNGAIAPGKTAFRPGELTQQANITNYTKGINGVMIDIGNLAGTPTAEDFDVYIRGDSEDWQQVSDEDVAEIAVTDHSGDGSDASHRIKLIWESGDDPAKQEWLKLVVLATENTGLATDEVFYFGNVPGDVDCDGDVDGDDSAEFGLAWDPGGSTTTLYTGSDFDRDIDVDGDDSATFGLAWAPSGVLTPHTPPLPDIAIDGFSSDGNHLLVDYTISDNPAQPFAVGVYASADGNTAGELLMTYTIDDPSALRTGQHQVAVEVDIDDLEMDYYLVAKLDVLDEVDESDETDASNLIAFSGGMFRSADGTIYVFGSDAETNKVDTVTIAENADNSMIDVTLNGTAQTYWTSNDDIRIRTHYGSDVVTGSEDLSDISMTVFGGSGNDILTGGAGDDVLHGNSGDDAIIGGSGDDTVIGGTGINSRIIDNGHAGDSENGGFYVGSGDSWSNTAYSDALYEEQHVSSEEDDKATWKFTDLAGGAVYGVFATWAASSTAAASATFTFDDEYRKWSKDVDQSSSPEGEHTAGSEWQQLGIVTLDQQADSLTVELVVGASQTVLADAVMLVSNASTSYAAALATGTGAGTGAGTGPDIPSTSAGEVPEIDLSIDTFSIVDGELQVDYDVTGANATPFDICIYASPDGSITETLLQTFSISDPDDLKTDSHIAAFPASFKSPNTDYYLVAKVDGSSKISETDESNNHELLYTAPDGSVFQTTDGIVHVHGRDVADTVTLSDTSLVLNTSSIDLSSPPASIPLAVSGFEIRTFGYADTVTLSMASGHVRVFGGAGGDVISGSGGSGTFELHGGPGNDTITGGTGNDALYGDADVDSLSGGTGEDFLDGGDGTESLFDGGAGFDNPEIIDDSDTSGGGFSGYGSWYSETDEDCVHDDYSYGGTADWARWTFGDPDDDREFDIYARWSVGFENVNYDVQDGGITVLESTVDINQTSVPEITLHDLTWEQLADSQTFSGTPSVKMTVDPEGSADGSADAAMFTSERNEVRIEATDPEAFEGDEDDTQGANTAEFTVTRAGEDNSIALVVYYAIETNPDDGTGATTTTDYITKDGDTTTTTDRSIAIPAGKSSVTITIAANDDSETEDVTEIVQLKLIGTNQPAWYEIGNYDEASIMIIDDDWTPNEAIDVSCGCGNSETGDVNKVSGQLTFVWNCLACTTAAEPSVDMKVTMPRDYPSAANPQLPTSVSTELTFNDGTTFNTANATPVGWENASFGDVFGVWGIGDTDGITADSADWTMDVTFTYGDESFTRTYSSDSAQDIGVPSNNIGKGFVIAADDSLGLSPSGSAPTTANLRLGTGRAILFNSFSADEFTSKEPGSTEYVSLVANREGDDISSYTLTDKYGTKSTFSTTGKLQQTEDSSGNVTIYARTGENLTSITHPDGSVVTYKYENANSMLSEIQKSFYAGGPTFTVAKFVQDGDGRITEIQEKSPGDGVTEFTHVTKLAYEGSTARISDITTPDGQETKYAFDPVTGRVDSITHPDGTVEYVAPYRVSTQAGSDGLQGVWTDELGRSRAITADRFGNVLTRIDELGNTTTYVRDNDGLLLRRIEHDANGNVSSDSAQTAYTYDDNGNRTSATYPDGTFETWTYHATLNRVTQHVDELGRKTKYELDSTTGQVLSRTRIVGSDDDSSSETDDIETSYTYTDGSNVDGTAPDESEWPKGLLLTETDPLGNVTTYEYNSRGLIEKITYEDDTFVEYDYDDKNNQIAQSDELGRRTGWEYDARKRVVQTLAYPDQTGDVLEDVTSTLAGSWNTVASGGEGDEYHTHADTPATSAEWEFTGLTDTQYEVFVTWVKDATNGTEEAPFSVYDGTVGGGSLLKTANVNQSIDPSGAAGIGDQWQSLGFAKISGGTLTVELNNTGVTGTIIADAVRIVEVQTLSTTSYDDGGNVIRTTDALGNATSYEYDSRGRQTKVFSPFVAMDTSYIVDDANPGANGYTETNGATVSWDDGSTSGYGGDSRYVEADDTEDPFVTWAVSNLTAGTEYELLVTWVGHETNNTDEAPLTVYDGTTGDSELGTVKIDQTEDPFGYPVDGREWKSLGRYTPSGTTLTVKLADSGATDGKYIVADAVWAVPARAMSQYVYDNAGQLTQTIDALGNITDYEYDEAGRQVKTISPYPDKDAAPINNGDTDYAQSTGHWTDDTTDGYSGDHSYATNADATATWTFKDVEPGKKYEVLATWVAYPDVESASDVASRAPFEIFDGTVDGTSLLKVTVDQTVDPDGHAILGQNWHELGEITAGGQTITVRLSGTADANCVVADAVKLVEARAETSTTYDALGNVTATTDALGNVTAYVDDPLGRFSKTIYTDPDGDATTLTATASASVRNAAGQLTRIVDSQGNVTEYEYDELGRQIKVLGPYPNLDGVVTVDDGDSAFDTNVTWSTGATSAATHYGKDYQTATTTTGSETHTATWTFDDTDVVVPGKQYEVLLSWIGSASYTDAALFTVHDGDTTSADELLNTTIDQEAGPQGHSIFGEYWQTLGVVTASDDALTIKLSNKSASSGSVIADAVMLVEARSETTSRYNKDGSLYQSIDSLGNATEYVYDNRGRQSQVLLPFAEMDADDIVDDNGEATLSDDDWTEVDTGGNEGDHYYAVQGDDATAEWAFTDLDTSIEYELLATWVGDADNTPIAPFEVFDGDINDDSMGTVTADQQKDPHGYIVDGRQWQSLGRYTPSGTTLTVQLTDEGVENGDYIVADAVWAVPARAMSQYVYDDAGQVIQSIDAEGLVTGYEYDYLGRQTAVKQYSNDGLIGNWELNTVAADGTTPDLSPYGNDGTLEEDAEVVDNVLVLPGDPTHDDASDVSSVEIPVYAESPLYFADDFSFHTRVYVDRYTDDGAYIESDSNVIFGALNYQLLLWENCNIVFESQAGGQVQTGNFDLLPGQWYDVTVTGDFGATDISIEIYVNGNLEGSGNVSKFTASTGSLFIGDSGRYWHDELEGKVDFLRAYDRVLSPGEIVAMTQSDTLYDSVGNVAHTVTPAADDYAKAFDANVDLKGNVTSFLYDDAGRQTHVLAPYPDPVGIIKDDNYLTYGPAPSPPTWSAGTSSGSRFDYWGDYYKILTVNSQTADAEATWTVSGLRPDTKYEILATWPEADEDLTDTGNSQAHFTVKPDGDELPGDEGLVIVDQSEGPTGHDILGSHWQSLGVFETTDGEFEVTISNEGSNTTDYVFADAIRVVEARPTTQYTYNTAGQLVSITDPLGNVTSYAYDDLVRQTTVTLPDPNGGNDHPAYETLYNAIGQTIATIDPLGNRTDYEYDLLGRQTAVLSPYPVDPATNNVVDDGDTDFNKSGTLPWVQETTDGGRGDDYYYHVIGTASDWATWTFFDLVPGKTYEVLATWVPGTDRATDAPFTVGVSESFETVVTADQTREPADAYFLGTHWHSLATVTADESSFMVGVTATTTGKVIADAVMVIEARPTTAYAYNDAGQLQSVTDPLGNVTSYEYDDLGRQISVTMPDPDGGDLASTAVPAVHTSYFDVLGRVVSQEDPLGNITSFEFDNLSRVVKTTDAETGVTSYAYDNVGRRTSLTDPVGNTTTWTFDVLGRVAEEENELGDSRFFQYDSLGQLVKRIDRNERVTTYDYDNLGRMTAEKWYEDVTDTEADETFTFVYDVAGRMLTAADTSSFSYAYTYDDLGRLDTVAQDITGLATAATVTLDAAYDDLGRRTGLTADVGSTADFATDYYFDNLGRPARIDQTARSSGTGYNAVAEKRADFTFDAAGRPISTTRYKDTDGLAVNRVTATDYVFDHAGRLTDLTHANSTGTVADYDLLYDTAGRITDFDFTATGGDDGNADYTYDDTNQLTDADYSNFTTSPGDEDYVYDANGNRTNNGFAVDANNNNQMTDGAGYAYLYDDEGNRTFRFVDGNADNVVSTGDTDITEYEWDHRNRLVKITHYATEGGAADKIIEYAYDHGNRWVRKVLDSDADGNANESTIFVHDGNDIVLQFDHSGTGDATAGDLSHRYLHAAAGDEVLADEQVADPATAGTRYWALGDHLNSIRDLVDDAGAVQLHRVYDAFGQITYETNGSGQLPTVYTLHAYTARPLDVDSNLQNNLHRWYDAFVAKWLSQDPIGFDGLDANLYRYVGNGSTSAVDPFGLWTMQGLLDAYAESYGGEEALGKLFGLGTSKGLKIKGACSLLDDWWKENDTIYIATTQWFGSERPDENAAAQLNEALAIHYDLGETSFFYKTGRVLRGLGKTAAGVLSAAAGGALIAASGGVTTIIGVPIVGFGISTTGEGLSQIFGFGEGENGYNIGADIAGNVGEFVGGEKGRTIATSTYYLADMGFSFAGGIASLRNLNKVEKVRFVGKWQGYPGDMAKVYNLSEKSGLRRVGTVVSVPWKLRVTAHSMEFVLAGQVVVEDINSARNGSHVDLSIGGMSEAEATQIAIQEQHKLESKALRDVIRQAINDHRGY